ncbi:MAG: spore coat associated protein CotJA [Clostridia bacterium]|nr:spore coat associated protein CotJA [Clostridia bacterium]
MNTRADRPNGCGCVDDHTLRCDDTPTAEVYGCTGLAMAFVPEQEFCDINEAEEALCRGSLFQKLDMPFYGQRRRNCK